MNNFLATSINFHLEYDTRLNTPWILESKNKINEFIRQLVPHTHFIDLASGLSLHSLTESEKDQFWSDHLHPSAAGYDKMAQIIYEKLKLVLMNEILELK